MEKTSTPRASRAMIQQRRAQIARIMNEREAVRVVELAHEFDVSQVTIRSDLVHLERAGKLVRDRGGAVATADAASGSGAPAIRSLLAIEQRAGLLVEEKKRIARAAANLVAPGDVIIMDAGTTVVEMTPFLAHLAPLTVVTNALNVALRLETETQAKVILLGGTLSRTSASTLGPLTEQCLNGMTVGTLFLGTQAWNDADGLTDTTMEIAGVKRAMINAARRIVLLADSSKWNSAGFIKVAPLSELHVIITDAGLTPAARAALEPLDAELTLV